MADLVVKGATDIPIDAFNISRFGNAHTDA